MTTQISFVKASDADFLTRLGQFMEDNGWVMTTKTSSAAKGTKAGVTIQFTLSYHVFYAQVTVGGISSANCYSGDYWSDGYSYRFISSNNNLFIWKSYCSVMVGLITITDKVGAWIGGTAWLGSYSGVDQFGRSNQYLSSTLFKDNAWVGYDGNSNVNVNELWGSIGADSIVMGPNCYNAAIVPIPIILCQYDSNTSYLHPIGFIPGVFRADVGAGGMYVSGDIITISGKNYTCINENALIVELG